MSIGLFATAHTVYPLDWEHLPADGRHRGDQLPVRAGRADRTGFGAREGLMTLLLSTMMPAPAAVVTASSVPGGHDLRRATRGRPRDTRRPRPLTLLLTPIPSQWERAQYLPLSRSAGEGAGGRGVVPGPTSCTQSVSRQADQSYQAAGAITYISGSTG